MSRFTGTPGDCWPLQTMLDELGEAARRAARPGWIWVAGFVYPTIALIPSGFGAQIFSSGESDDPELFQAAHDPESLLGFGIAAFVALIVMFLILAPLFRLNAGLARLAPRAVWDRVSGNRGRPGLRDCWKAGKGLTLSVLGLRLSVDLLRYSLLLLMLVPAAFAWNVLESLSAQGPGAIVLAVLALPALAVLLIYNLLLSLLQQLALHSLVHNRRGVASALQHAWSILRQDPWAAGRALTGEILLAVIALVLEVVVLIVTLGSIASIAPLAALLGLALSIGLFFLACIFGVTRACYWAAAYRALGGLSPDDGVPGLEGLLDARPEDLREA